MLTYKISTERQTDNDEAQREAFNGLLNAYRMDGHVLGRELITISVGSRLEAFVQIPAADAFEAAFVNEWITKALEAMRLAGLSASEFAEIDPDEMGSECCRCADPPSFILFTGYTQLQPPISCGGCFRSVPLYRFQRFKSGEFYEVITWVSDYQACDTLFMNSRTGERFSYRQISEFDSSLSRRGRDLCQHFEQSTGKPTYYYLYRYRCRNPADEESRPCPSCGGNWQLPDRWHQLFDFRCETCRLISNIAPALR